MTGRSLRASFRWRTIVLRMLICVRILPNTGFHRTTRYTKITRNCASGSTPKRQLKRHWGIYLPCWMEFTSHCAEKHINLNNYGVRQDFVKIHLFTTNYMEIISPSIVVTFWRMKLKRNWRDSFLEVSLWFYSESQRFNTIHIGQHL